MQASPNSRVRGGPVWKTCSVCGLREFESKSLVHLTSGDALAAEFRIRIGESFLGIDIAELVPWTFRGLSKTSSSIRQSDPESMGVYVFRRPPKMAGFLLFPFKPTPKRGYTNKNTPESGQRKDTKLSKARFLP